MTRLSVLERLRETYKVGTWKDLERQFQALSYFLLEEDREKIRKAIEKKKLVNKALTVLGGEVVDR